MSRKTDPTFQLMKSKRKAYHRDKESAVESITRKLDLKPMRRYETKLIKQEATSFASLSDTIKKNPFKQ